MSPPPLPMPAKSERIRSGKLHWLFAAPGILLTIIGLTFVFDFTSEQTGGERSIEQSLGLLVLIIAAFFLIAAFMAWLLRPYQCATCQTKLHRRALSCRNCHAEFI